jgi:predicted hydrocarbon binding protein
MVVKRKTESSGTVEDDSYLVVDNDSGEIRTASGERASIISAGLLSAMCDAMHDKLGEEVRDVLYTAGVEWGRREFEKFKAEAEAENKLLYHIRNMGLNDFKVKFNQILTRSGWGEFDIDEKHDFVFIHLYNSAYGEMVSRHNRMYNDLFAGFFAGFFSDLIGVDFDSVEVSFLKDNLEGIYLLADESVVMTVRKWVDDGRTHEDILRSLQKREYKKGKRKSADVKETYSEEAEEELE